MPQITYIVDACAYRDLASRDTNANEQLERDNVDREWSQACYSRFAVWGVSAPSKWLKTLSRDTAVQNPPVFGRSAQAIASVIHGPPRLTPAAPASDTCAFYRHKDKDFDLFIKILKQPRPPRAWPESVYSRWAGDKGWGPKPYPSHDASNALVTDFLPVPHLTFAQTQQKKVQNLFIANMRALHRSVAPRCENRNSDAVELLGWRLFEQADYRIKNGNNLPLCDVMGLRQRMTWLLQELSRQPVKYVLCHFDTLRRNQYLYKGRLLMIDWELARLADPQRDLAKFFGFYQVRAEDVGGILGAYYLGPPTAQDSRRFAIWLQAMSIDRLAWHFLSEKRCRAGIKIKVKQIKDLSRLLNDDKQMPALHWEL